MMIKCLLIGKVLKDDFKSLIEDDKLSLTTCLLREKIKVKQLLELVQGD